MAADLTSYRTPLAAGMLRAMRRFILLGSLALTLAACTTEEGPKPKIQVMHTPTPHATIAGGTPTAPAGGGSGGPGAITTGTSGGATAPLVTGDTTFRPYPGCEKPLVYDMKCWTEKFPRVGSIGSFSPR